MLPAAPPTQIEVEITASQFSALSSISHYGPITLGKLASVERLRPPTVTRMVSALEESGLVQRRADTDDRRFFFGQLVSVSGTWMQQLAQDWLVLRLTNRALPVGITTALQFAPVLVLGIWGGLIADRLDKRRLLLATQGAMSALALALGVLTATGSVRLWMIYLLALLLGFATAFDMPARQAFVTEMVGPDHLANAVGLNSAVFNSARIIGPAVAGVLIGVVGIAPAFFVNALSYLAVMTSLSLMDPEELYRQAPVGRSPGQVRDGVRYVWATPTLRWTI